MNLFRPNDIPVPRGPGQHGGRDQELDRPVSLPHRPGPDGLGHGGRTLLRWPRSRRNWKDRRRKEDSPGWFPVKNSHDIFKDFILVCLIDTNTLKHGDGLVGFTILITNYFSYCKSQHGNILSKFNLILHLNKTKSFGFSGWIHSWGAADDRPGRQAAADAPDPCQGFGSACRYRVDQGRRHQRLSPLRHGSHAADGNDQHHSQWIVLSLCSC